MIVVKKVFLILLIIWLLYFVNSYAATGTITTEGARVRREANTESDIVTIVYNGETVEIIEKEGIWYKIKYGESIGYIREDLMNVEGEITTSTQTPEDSNVSGENTIDNEDNKEEPISQEQEKQVSSDTVIRIIPSLSASIVGELKAGTKVTIVKTINSWCCISYENKKVWVVSSFLEEIIEEDNQQIETKTGYVNVSAAIIRKGPSTSAEIITEWGMNKPVEILAEEGDWYKINFEGQDAYVAKRLISENVTSTSRGIYAERELLDEHETLVVDNIDDVIVLETSIDSDNKEEIEGENNILNGEAVVTYAKQYLGYDYVYGGAGPNNFDCSGFTQYVYKQFGIQLAHSAITQSNNGRYVTKSDLQLGDLVIFRDWDNSGIGHCGIYVGEGNFIHAANSTRGVVIDTLNSGYYYERYVSGRRLF